MGETFKPATEAALVDCVAWAMQEKAPLELVGRGTKRAIGRPAEAAHRLDLSGFAGIASYEPEELVLTAGPGTGLAEIEAVLAQRGQHLAFEPPDLSVLLGGVGSGTLGGAVMGNLAGPRRFAAGAARDHLLGFHGVNGRGEAFKSGGAVVKNVTGYDLSKLLAGSWGTLAALTQVTLKVLPRPERVATGVLEGLDAGQAGDAMRLALGGPHEVSGAAWAGTGEGSALWLRLEGPAPSIAARAASLETRLAGIGVPRWLEHEESLDLWRQVRDAAPLTAAPEELVWKVSVPPARGPALVAALPEAKALMDWGGGLVWLVLPPSPDAGAARIRAAIAGSGGHATLIRAPEALRRTVAVFEPLAPALAALALRVKQGFDPLGLFNPGRLYPGF